MTQCDLLSIAGIEHSTFQCHEDVTLVSDDKEPVARIFRRDGKIVYRTGTSFEWDDKDGHPVRH